MPVTRPYSGVLPPPTGGGHSSGGEIYRQESATQSQQSQTGNGQCQAAPPESPACCGAYGTPWHQRSPPTLAVLQQDGAVWKLTVGLTLCPGNEVASIQDPRLAPLTYGGNRAFLCCIRCETARLWRVLREPNRSRGSSQQGAAGPPPGGSVSPAGLRGGRDDSPWLPLTPGVPLVALASSKAKGTKCLLSTTTAGR